MKKQVPQQEWLELLISTNMWYGTAHINFYIQEGTILTIAKLSVRIKYSTNFKDSCWSLRKYFMIPDLGGESKRPTGVY
jgi:hypothetical protein